MIRHWPIFGPAAPAISLFALLLLPGCSTFGSSVGSVAGTVTGAASGTGSVNPALGYAVGIGTKAAVDALVHYISRKRHQAEQDQIASAVGALSAGQSTVWRIRHKIPIGDQHGTVTVIRDIPNALTSCKEVIFTVIADKAPAGERGHYATSICEQGNRWKWAQAEPATPRWGVLQ